MSYHCSLSQFREPTGETNRTRRIGAWLLAKIKEQKDASFIPQPYRSVSEFFGDAGVFLPSAKRTYWRLTEIKVGEFRACPRSRGFLIATNGILAFTLNELGQTFLGHLENFIADEVVVEGNEKQTASLKTDARKAKRRAVLDELRELLA